METKVKPKMTSETTGSQYGSGKLDYRARWSFKGSAGLELLLKKSFSSIFVNIKQV